MSLLATAATVIIDVVKTRLESRGRIKEAKEQAQIEAIKARVKNPGYMDDLLLWMHAGPIMGVFFPATRESTLEGIDALSALPEWYLAVWFTMIAAVWGAPKLADLKIKK